MELHILEPTLFDQTGHCHGYLLSLLQTKRYQPNYRINLWVDRRGRHLYQGENCQVIPYFIRQLRKIQMYFCLKRLIRTNKNLFIPTAGRWDLLCIHYLLANKPYAGKIFLHFHQIKMTTKKMQLLKEIARHRQDIIILAPTERILSIFKNCGFSHCKQVPCPVYPPSPDITYQTATFRKIIYAGAARADKGFPLVVDFVTYLALRAPDIAIELQISAPHSTRYDKTTQQALSRLTAIRHPHLTLHQTTLDQLAFRQLFQNAICLLLYDANSYRDKFSGILLEALYAGCPVICMADTWAGDVVQRYSAGIALKDQSLTSIYEAVTTIRQHYAIYQQQALQARSILIDEHHPQHTWLAIEQHVYHLQQPMIV